MKVLLLTGRLQNYRVPILDKIVSMSDVELTVAHSHKSILPNEGVIKEVILEERQFWKFTKHEGGLIDLCNQYDVVVAMLYLQKLSFMRLLAGDRKFKLLFWGIGVKASLDSKFDSPSILNKVRYKIARKADAMIFYTDYARNKYIDQGVDERKLFVMQNTVDVNYSGDQSIVKNRILFIGTLYRAKKIFELLESYHEAFLEDSSIPVLDIIGKGVELENMQLWIEKYKMQDRIILHGAIYDEDILSTFFERSLATISPGQAGLSVLKSMGYGVPFITMRDAITGGERLNISDGVNGIFYDEDNELKDILLDITKRPSHYLQLGVSARDFYQNHRSPEVMAGGFIEAVNYVSNSNNKI